METVEQNPKIITLNEVTEARNRLLTIDRDLAAADIAGELTMPHELHPDYLKAEAAWAEAEQRLGQLVLEN